MKGNKKSEKAKPKTPDVGRKGKKNCDGGN